MLIAALNKYWGKVSPHEFWHKMGVEDTNAAIKVMSLSGLPKDVADNIWKKDLAPGFYLE
jgi:hypothetical protein